MKKYIVYLFALSMSFAPIHNAYAFSMTKGELIQIGSKGGALIKSNGGKLFKLSAIGIGIEGGRIATGAAWSWCKNNQKKCKDKIGDAYEVICDLTNCEVERKEEIEDESGQCIIRYGKNKQTLSAFLASQTRTEDRNASVVNYYPADDTHSELQKAGQSAINSANKNFSNWTYLHGYYNMGITTTYKKTGESIHQKSRYYAQIWIKCGGQSDDDKKLSDSELEELAKKIAKNMDDDDIKNYYNYDYGDITINNHKYDGDEINNETNIEKQCTENSCNEISKEIEQDINNKKYDIDDVNEQNCTMENKKYVSCNVKKDGDDDDEENNTTNNTTNNTKKDDDDDPYKCGTTDLTKKICNFIDWSKSDDYDDENDKLKIKEHDEDEPNTKVDFNGACPAPYIVDISFEAGFMGKIEYDFMLLNTPELCEFLDDWVEPIIYVLGPLHAIYILGGNRENV